jgi:hypothetical protein
MKKQPQLPEGVVLKKVMLTDANGIPDGRHVFVMARPEPKPTSLSVWMAELEALKQNRLAMLDLGIKGFSPSQIQRLSDMVEEIEKKIEALSQSSPVDHGPYADNGIGYKRYVCDTNPNGFCLMMQNHIASLIHEITTYPNRVKPLGEMPSHSISGTPLGKVNPSDLSAVIKRAECLDEDMHEHFVMVPITGEDKDLTKLRHELWCLVGMAPETRIYERGNPKGI